MTTKRRGRKSLLTEEEREQNRREYQHEYYLAHRDEAKAYQRRYHATYKRKSRAVTSFDKGRTVTAKKEVREKVKTGFTPSDLMNMSPEKLERISNRILSGRAELVGAK